MCLDRGVCDGFIDTCKGPPQSTHKYLLRSISGGPQTYNREEMTGSEETIWYGIGYPWCPWRDPCWHRWSVVSEEDVDYSSCLPRFRHSTIRLVTVFYGGEHYTWESITLGFQYKEHDFIKYPQYPFVRKVKSTCQGDRKVSRVYVLVSPTHRPGTGCPFVCV